MNLNDVTEMICLDRDGHEIDRAPVVWCETRILSQPETAVGYSGDLARGISRSRMWQIECKRDTVADGVLVYREIRRKLIESISWMELHDERPKWNYEHKVLEEKP